MRAFSLQKGVSYMATFNVKTSGRMKTTNRSGHAAYKYDDRTKLVTMALTTMLSESKYYGDNTDELIKLAESMCDNGDGEFVAKLAVWARTKGNLRSVSHDLISVVSYHCSGEKFIRPAARAIASMRGDDGTEIFATYKALYGKDVRWPHAIQRGIMDALSAESPYAVAKYQSKGRSVTLRDTLRMTHPKAERSDTNDAMGECVAGSLPMPKSWETELSARGNTKEVWDELIAEDKVPFMAALRNLRNMIGVGANIDPILDKLSDREAVAKSRQLPFRFYSAYRELCKAGLDSSKVSRAIDMALSHACRNADKLPGRTAVLIDTSGSMGWRVSERSIVSCRDTAAVLGAMIVRISDDAKVIGFDSRGYQIPMSGLSVLSDIGNVPDDGGWTDMAAGFGMLAKTGFDADRVIILSDNEVNRGTSTMQGQMDAYRRRVGHDVWCHAIDLQGYGTTQFIGPKTNYIGGWSESVLRFVSLAEMGFGTLVDEIDATEL